jgi:hypothetical protein
MLALLLGGGFLSHPAKTADQVAASSQEAIAVGAAVHLNYRLFLDPRAEAMKKVRVAYQVDNCSICFSAGNLIQLEMIDLSCSLPS